MPTFKHSGDLSDILYSLPAISALGGGVLHLDTTGGASDPHVAQHCPRGRTNFDAAAFEFLRPLLLQQPCIANVLPWNGESVDHNLNQFRSLATDDRLNFVLLYLRSFGLSEARWNDPWLTLASPPISLPQPNLIHRSPRFHSQCFWWENNIATITANAVFIGSPRDHDLFTQSFGCQTQLHQPHDALELARIIQGAKHFYGNQSFPMSIAHGLATTFTQEPYDYGPHAFFQRPGGHYMQIIMDAKELTGHLPRPTAPSVPPTFKHSGDLGDIIYSLPTIKALGGGILYLDTTGGVSDPYIQRKSKPMKFNSQGYETIRPLLMHQPYIRDVRPWRGESVEYNLDAARAFINFKLNLAAAYLTAFGLDPALHGAPWLTVNAEPIRLHKSVVLNRTLRYQSKDHVWYSDLRQFAPNAVFIGYPKEHAVFQAAMDCPVEYFPTTDALEIARILLGSSMLIANQSFIMSLAIGLGTRYNMEVCDYSPNCLFERDNGHHF